MKKILYTLFTLIILNSCTNLDPEMYDVISPEIDFPGTESDAKALVVSAAYSPFRSRTYYGIFNVASGVQIISDMVTDLGVCKWVNDNWTPLTHHSWDANHYYATRNYSDYHRDISKMTLTLDRIKDVNMPESTLQLMNGELHLGRGWMAYLLYDMYGPVSIATLEELQDPLQDVIIPRPTREWMYNYIETELKAAIERLPYHHEASDYGRFTKGLAYTVLLKLYMLEKDWAKAEAVGKELLKPEYGYDLVPKYADIFTFENQKNNEIIYAYPCQRGVGLQLWHDHCLPGSFPVENRAIQRWDGFKVPWAFYHTFDKADERLEVLVGEYTYYSSSADAYITWDEESQVASSGSTYSGAVPVKYGEDPASTGDGSQIDYIVYRFADVLTLLSEAMVRNGGVTQEALNHLNRVRTRAGLVGYTLADISSPEDMLDKILQERGHELWWEGARRADLIRHGKFIQNAKDRGVNSAEKFLLFPLPQKIINEGKGKIHQNPDF